MRTEELENYEDCGGERSTHRGAEVDKGDEETSHHCVGRGVRGEAGADPDQHCWAEAVVDKRENIGTLDREIIAIGACHRGTIDTKLVCVLPSQKGRVSDLPCKNCSCCIEWHPHLS